jgi:hypothetical protein
MGEGPALIARLSGAPVMLAGLACEPSIKLKSWDRVVVPLPFARGAVVWDGPFGPEDAPETWGARLVAATRAAEAELA